MIHCAMKWSVISVDPFCFMSFMPMERCEKDRERREKFTLQWNGGSLITDDITRVPRSRSLTPKNVRSEWVFYKLMAVAARHSSNKWPSQQPAFQPNLTLYVCVWWERNKCSKRHCSRLVYRSIPVCVAFGFKPTAAVSAKAFKMGNVWKMWEG